MLAAATASWMARLMPTPPSGDIACAASPIARKPSRHHVFSRLTCTSRSLTCCQSVSSSARAGSTGSRPFKPLAEGRQSAGADAFVGPLGDHEGALPIVAAIEHDENRTGGKPALRLVGVVGAARQAKPQHVHRRAQILDFETGRLPQDRAAPIGGDGQRRVDLDGTAADPRRSTPVIRPPSRRRSFAAVSISRRKFENRVPGRR